MRNRRVLAVVRRARYVGLVALAGAEILEARVRRLTDATSSRVAPAFIRSAVKQLATDYGLATLVLEPGSRVRRWLSPLYTAPHEVSLDDAKMRLDVPVGASQLELFHVLVGNESKCARFMGHSADGREILPPNRHREVILLAIALGLAFNNSN